MDILLKLTARELEQLKQGKLHALFRSNGLTNILPYDTIYLATPLSMSVPMSATVVAEIRNPKPVLLYFNQMVSYLNKEQILQDRRNTMEKLQHYYPKLQIGHLAQQQVHWTLVFDSVKVYDTPLPITEFKNKNHDTLHQPPNNMIYVTRCATSRGLRISKEEFLQPYTSDDTTHISDTKSTEAIKAEPYIFIKDTETEPAECTLFG